MASADCVTSAGSYSAATYLKAGASDCVTSAGLASAPTRVAWAGSRARRESVDWLPRADEMWFDVKTGRPTRRFYQFMREVAETRLGGAQGATVPQVATTVTQTQAQVVEATNYAQQVGQYAQGIAATVEAAVGVMQDTGIEGSDSIPPPPERPGAIS